MKQASPRIISVDIMRGLVVVLMALDHTRDYFSNALFGPMDLNQTNAAYFLTRWITHICAPTFIFLAGSSAYLSGKSKNLSTKELSGYLFRRGILLIFLELTLIRFGWTFNWDYHYAIAQVIWVLGWAMVVLAGLIYLPRYAVVVFAMTLMTGHNLFDGIRPEDTGNFAWLWTILHVPGAIEYLPGYSIVIFYPLIPWVAVMAAGYCTGPLFLRFEESRQKSFALIGISAILLFLILRLSNIYGDPHPWIPQKNELFTFFSFLKCEKYPPSLLYLLMTLGPMFIGLALFEWQKIHRFCFILVTFGESPLLFYICHIFLIHSIAFGITLARGLPVDWLMQGSVKMPFPEVPASEYGFNLSIVYAIWLLILILLYPICRVYINRKNDSETAFFPIVKQAMPEEEAIKLVKFYADKWDVPWQHVLKTYKEPVEWYLPTRWYTFSIDTGDGEIIASIYLPTAIVDRFEYFPSKKNAFLLPLWVAYPTYNSVTSGCRQGYGEVYKHNWHSFYRSLNEDEKADYKQKYPPPDDEDRLWHGFYEFIADKPAEDENSIAEYVLGRLP